MMPGGLCKLAKITNGRLLGHSTSRASLIVLGNAGTGVLTRGLSGGLCSSRPAMLCFVHGGK